MATTLYLRDTVLNDLPGYRDMIAATPGSSATTGVVNTVASGTEIQWTKTAGGLVMVWTSPPLAAGFTLSGTMTFSIWAIESHMNANAGGRSRVFRRQPNGTETEVGGGPYDDGVEFSSTANTEMVWTGLPTSTAFNAGDRIVVRYYITGVGTMAGGFTCTLTYDAAAAATGDSFFQVNENITFSAEETVGEKMAAAYAPAIVPWATVLPTGAAWPHWFGPIEPPAVVLPPLTWQPVYADIARGPEPLATDSLTTFAYVPAISRWGIDGGKIPWAPDYPDRALPAPDANAWTGALAFLPDLPSFPVPDLAWSPAYPDRAPGAEPLPVGVPFYAAAIEPPPQPEVAWWVPVYPDQTVLAAPDPNAWRGAAVLIPDLPSFAVPDLAWGPRYADAAPGPTPLVASDLTTLAYVPAIGEWGIDGGKVPWLPDYPDFARAAPDATAPLGAFAFLPDLASFPLPAPLPWAPVYPDFARAAPDPNEWRGTPFAFLPDLASFPLPDPLVWQGRYPDAAPASEPPVAQGWIALVRVDAAAVPPLSWWSDSPMPIFPAPGAWLLRAAVIDPRPLRRRRSLPDVGIL